MASFPTAHACPDAACLAAFDRGDLPSEELEAITRHLDGCQRCRSGLKGLPESGDNLLATLRMLKGTAGEEDPILPQESELLQNGAPAGLFSKASLVSKTAALPERLDEYHLVEKIGEGGMGAVYRAV